MPFVKRAFAQRALGLSGDVPEFPERRSSLAAQMKSFTDKPPIECVE